ncbi:hypothetical protein BAUCODRAFT_32279 [Baudoinia panamericana UAMH 10762]|uniref:Histone-lysine N-methyltransferase, H3 lysine-79 specific n=1 Tax=Baudoinia panamericana (strain UAMH 10762) TaxID=717646 RepID=M2LUK1_BAUPA|nr:uncharacterized protein BAUCODRAFT_32279 [Baudoinia panamericana UAMH 10762]EMC98267.1 hypothetical protein BAUCODRAFT_32279 [Baudoinia panamericana UAMH 10762]
MNFFGNRAASGNGNAKQPAIRKVTTQVAVKPGRAVGASSTAPASPAPASLPARSRNTERFKLSGSRKQKQTSTLRHKALDSSSRGVKRKSATPDVQFSDEEQDDSSDIGTSDSDASRKRPKSSVSSVETLSASRRCIVPKAAFRNGAPLSFIHGAHLTSGEYRRKYVNPWEQPDFSTVELQYPSKRQRESFELKWPLNENDDYRPMEDIRDTIETIVKFYYPEDLVRKYTEIEHSYARRFARAFQLQSIQDWIKIVQDFNHELRRLINDGSIERELQAKRGLHLEWIQRILDQVFVRTVSPTAESLNKYKSGSDNVYGELLPPFVSEIFRKVGLTHDHVFVDLGSGVGNVVLQAALEIGCESWGIEMMHNPCELADAQAAEFASRTQLWGLDVGEVNFLRGDMTKHSAVPGLLQRADVVLVNNQAFTPELNDKLKNMFLDLKEGARIVSLKPFVPIGHKMAVRNVEDVANQFVQKQDEYFSNSVSWSHYGNNHWYIATKDTRPLRAFRKKAGLG